MTLANLVNATEHCCAYHIDVPCEHCGEELHRIVRYEWDQRGCEKLYSGFFYWDEPTDNFWICKENWNSYLDNFMTNECPECGRKTNIEKCWTCDPVRGG